MCRLEEQAVTSSAVATENDDLRGKLLKALESIDIREQHAVCQVSPQDPIPYTLDSRP